MTEEQNTPRTTQDLVRHLADTLVESEVMQPMERIGWSHGTPPPPSNEPESKDNPPTPGGAPPTPQTPQPAQPSGTTPQTRQTPEPKESVKQDVALGDIDFESFKDPATGQYLGKYKTREEFIRGIGHAVKMAKQAFSERDLSKQEVLRLQDELNKASQNRTPASPAGSSQSFAPDAAASRKAADEAQAKLEQVLTNVAEDGGILDTDSVKSLLGALREANEAVAKANAEELQLQRDAASRKENDRWSAVDEYMRTNHPDAEKFADEIGLFVQSNPLLAEAITALAAQGKDIRAAELAWTEYDKARGSESAAAQHAADSQKEIEMQAADQVRQEAVDKARKDAGVITSAAGGVHESGSPNPSQDEINAAAAAMRAYGTTPGNPAAARWRELTIGRMLPPEIFGS